MCHLEKEFSNENLLFLTTVWQWRDKLYSKHLIDTPIILYKDRIKLPSNVPLSSIVSMKPIASDSNDDAGINNTCSNSVSIGIENNQNQDQRTDIGKDGKNVSNNYHLTIAVFQAIYLKYIQRDKAPLEMCVNLCFSLFCLIGRNNKQYIQQKMNTTSNIGHELREKLKCHYLHIKQAYDDNGEISHDCFLVIWDDIIKVSKCVYENLFSSFVRFKDM